MALIVLLIIGLVGAKAATLRWQPFALLAGLTLPAMALKIVTTASALERMGESAAGLYDPVNIATSFAVQWAIWSVVYLTGFGVGKFMRRTR